MGSQPQQVRKSGHCANSCPLVERRISNTDVTIFFVVNTCELQNRMQLRRLNLDEYKLDKLSLPDVMHAE